MKQYKFIKKLEKLSFVEQIWLFGSRARGDHHERSDIDLAIMCPKATPHDWIKVMSIVENADTLLNIDCVSIEADHIGKGFYKNIITDKKVLYQQKNRT